MKKDLQNGQGIMDLITKIQEQLTVLERKVDSLISRSLPKPAEAKPFPKPFQQPVNIHVQNGNRQDNRFQAAVRHDNRHGERVMYKTICADCKKGCEVPFRPSGNRPVYCQECFLRRKSSSSFKVNTDNRPKETAPVQVTNIDTHQASEKKKPVTKKKSAEKKKPVSKKIKSGK
ncbi:MAG: hypothetical protein Q8O30_00910 [Candidatus Omnitrophota bacterium]|nr:hypothetical protein [Candidatus Omnitrophota bacterium]